MEVRSESLIFVISLVRCGVSPGGSGPSLLCEGEFLRQGYLLSVGGAHRSPGAGCGADPGVGLCVARCCHWAAPEGQSVVHQVCRDPCQVWALHPLLPSVGTHHGSLLSPCLGLHTEHLGTELRRAGVCALMQEADTLCSWQDPPGLEVAQRCAQCAWRTALHCCHTLTLEGCCSLSSDHTHRDVCLSPTRPVVPGLQFCSCVLEIRGGTVARGGGASVVEKCSLANLRENRRWMMGDRFWGDLKRRV